MCNIWTTDTFYSSLNKSLVQKLDIAGVEMEGASLYLNAKLANANALCICTVSDDIYSGKSTTSSEREKNFFKMFELALSISSTL